MQFRISGSDGAVSTKRCMEIAQRATPTFRTEVLIPDAGGYMVLNVLPNRFRASGPGWAPVARGGSPLIDTGRLRSSNDWRDENGTLVVGNTAPQARLQNRGGTVVPKRAKFLAIPLSPPLSGSQARTAKPRQFSGAFVLMRGPQGAGLYRKTGRGIERIFAFVKKATIKARPFLYFDKATRAAIATRWQNLLVRGRA